MKRFTSYCSLKENQIKRNIYSSQVKKAAVLLNDCLKRSGFSGKWDDTRGYKCSPPLLDGPRNDKDIATSALLSNTRQIFQKFNKYGFDEQRSKRKPVHRQKNYNQQTVLEKLTKLCPGRFPSRLWAGTLTSSNPCWDHSMLSNQQ